MCKLCNEWEFEKASRGVGPNSFTNSKLIYNSVHAIGGIVKAPK